MASPRKSTTLGWAVHFSTAAVYTVCHKHSKLIIIIIIAVIVRVAFYYGQDDEGIDFSKRRKLKGRKEGE